MTDELGKKYLEFEKTAPIDATVNDFFDHIDLSMEDRSDFLFSAVLRSAIRVESKERKEAMSLEN